MIKNLKLKFVLVFLLLVVSVFITSSCYAQDYPEFPTYEDYKYNEYVIYYRTSDNKLILWHFASDYENSFEFKCDILTDTIMGCYVVPNNDVYYNYYFLSDNSWILDPDSINTNYIHRSSGHHNLSGNVKNGIVFTTIDITNYDTGELLFPGEEINSVGVTVSHEFNDDMSAKVIFDYSSYGDNFVLKYSLTGIDVNADLTAPITLKNAVTYNPSLTNLVVAPNTKVYWVLYDSSGNTVETDVYQVPEYDAVIENSDKKIEYNVVYSEDYTSATLNANLLNGIFSDKIVYSKVPSLNPSTGKLVYGYQSFTGSLKLIENGSIYLYALDNFDNVIALERVDITDIFNFKDSDFSYTLENKSSLHGGYKLIITPKVKNWSSQVDIKFNVNITTDILLPTVFLDTDFPDFSYLDSYTVGGKTFSGRIMSGDSIIITCQDNQFKDLEGKIDFKIYKKSDNSLIFDKTYSFNVNHFSPGDIVDGSSGDISGTLPGGSSNSGDFTFNDYGDVDWNDVEDYLGTSGSFWTIVKNILNQLPKWITAPLFFFISAVVAIALIKAILPG